MTACVDFSCIILYKPWFDYSLPALEWRMYKWKCIYDSHLTNEGTFLPRTIARQLPTVHPPKPKHVRTFNLILFLIKTLKQLTVLYLFTFTPPQWKLSSFVHYFTGRFMKKSSFVNLFAQLTSSICTFVIARCNSISSAATSFTSLYLTFTLKLILSNLNLPTFLFYNCFICVSIK